MPNSITRRRALLGLSAGSLLVPLGACNTTNGSGQLADVSFDHGVASGDPDHQSVVLWTHVTSGEAVLAVNWEIARDADFIDVVDRGEFRTSADRDYTVKVLASGLKAGTTYYYRFVCAGKTSPTGRTRTLPRGHVSQLGIALASCSNYPFGYFNAYEVIARDPAVDVVLHLGDYIYEYGPDGYGGPTGKKIRRDHAPAHEIVSLADYRERHAQYKSDVQSKEMHAAHPLIAIWDDHESANNPWMGGAQNHQADAEGDWRQRRDASMQAYFEWMPVREPHSGGSRAQYWRDFRFGDLASLTTVETRHTGRSEQIEYPDYADQLTSRADAKRFMRDVVGAKARDMLSAQGEAFLFEAIAASVKDNIPWRLLGNQIPMARTHAPYLAPEIFEQLHMDPSHPLAGHLQRFERLGKLDLPIYLDPWDGYPAARERLYQTLTKLGVNDLLVLTGDSHSFWANALYDQGGHPMGLELGTSGITSPGDFIGFGERGARLMDQKLAEHNREVVWTDGLHNGYVRLVLRHDQATADYVAVSNILSREYSVKPLRHYTIERRDGTLVYS